MRSIFRFSMVCAILFIMPLFSNAQIPSSEFSLTSLPQYPEANQSYTVSLKAPSINAQSIRWFVDGIEDTQNKNKNDLLLTAGEIGVQTTVLVRATLQDGSVAETKLTTTPNRIDLLIDADTLSPPFYKGKNLPSSGSTVKITALVFTKENRPESQYSYVWKVNGSVQNGGAVKGINTMSFVPSFDTATRISVDVLDAAGQIIASTAQTVPIVEPELIFYEHNPLRGLSFVAMSNPYIFVNDEVRVHAEGYYMGRELAGANILKEWKINGRVVASDPQNSQEISLHKDGNSGQSQLSLHIRNLKQLLQGVQNSLIIQF